MSRVSNGHPWGLLVAMTRGRSERTRRTLMLSICRKMQMGDGFIDHIIVYCRLGFSDGARRCLDRLTKLWIERGRVDEESERGRKEWRVALEDIAPPGSFQESPLLQDSRVWQSTTPYLKTRFDKVRPKTFDQTIGTYRAQIATSGCVAFQPYGRPTLSRWSTHPIVSSYGLVRADRAPPLAFARTRRGRGGLQPDTSGGFFRLTLEHPISGPIALGWGAHFGLGTFGAVT
jgi:CRISPR-associated protein Csb2